MYRAATRPPNGCVVPGLSAGESPHNDLLVYRVGRESREPCPPADRPRMEKSMTDFNTLIQKMILDAVNERIDSVEALESRMVNQHGEYITTKRAAELMNVDPGTVRAMCRDGRLKAATAEGHAPLILVRSMAGMVESTDTELEIKPKRKRKYDNAPKYYIK